MNAYLALEIWFLIAAFLAYKIRLAGMPRLLNGNASSKIEFIILTFIPLIILSGFRGRSTGTDYVNYQYAYERVIKNFTIREVISEGESLFALIQKIVGELSDYNIVALMTALAIITVSAYYILFYKYSELPWLSLFMLLVVGSYYTSFNTTRQFLAAALYALCIEFILKKKPIKYALSVYLISLIHNSTIVMIPFYFLLNLNWKKKKNFAIAFGIILAFLIVIFFTNDVFRIAGRYLYANYVGSRYADGSRSSSYSLVRIVFFILILILNRDVIDLNSPLDRICVNAVIYLTVISIVSQNVYILYRFTYFMLPMVLIYIPNLILRKKSLKAKMMNYFVVGGFLILYMISVQSGIEFEWYWQ